MTPPPLARPWKFFKATLYEKVRFFAVFQQELQNSTMFDVWWSFFIPIQYAIKIDCIWYYAVIFCVSEFQKKWANLRLQLNVQSKKCFSFRGLRPPDLPTRGSAPGPHWGLRPQTTVIGSRSARSPCPPLQNPKYATARRLLLMFDTAES